MGDTFMLDMPQVVVPQPRTALADPNLPECRCYGALRWAVALAHPRADRFAQWSLHRLGLTAYRPTFAVRCRSPHGHEHTEARSLFPGYLFVLHEPGTSWRQIRDAPGVSALVRSGRNLDYARPGDIEALMAGDELRATPTPAGPVWAPGAPCSLGRGHVLEGQPAVVIAAARELVTVAVMMLGQLRHVSVPVDSLVVRD